MLNNITEAERQVLIALIEMANPIETPNNTHYTFYPKTIEEAAAYFRSFRVDWSLAYESLSARGFLQEQAGSYALTAAGAEIARQERLDHPPIWYWYREYYTITAKSQVYARFCEELYGRNLCQTDFSDMSQIELLFDVARIQPGDRVLDLGCGSGLFAEYLSDRTGAKVWGVDYVPEAVQQAQQRTIAKRDRLAFQVGNFDHLDFPAGSFDLLISIDTLYMPNDLPATLKVLDRMLKANGKMLVFYLTILFDPNKPRDTLQPEHTDLAIALGKAGLPYRTWDLNEPTFHLMRKKHQLAKAMRADFEAEGTLFLYDHLMAESDSGTAPYDAQKVNISRYLYKIR